MEPILSEESTSTRQWPEAEELILKILGSLILALLTILSAQVRIPLPFTPVPMTLQTFVAPLAGGFLGAWWGGLSMGIYILLGMLGLNVFATADSGLAFFMAPTAGYVIGFFFAATIVGAARKRFPESYSSIVAAIVISHIVIFGLGVLGLMLNADMNFHTALAKGVFPFWLGDILKIIASSLVLGGYQYFNSTRQTPPRN